MIVPALWCENFLRYWEAFITLFTHILNSTLLGPLNDFRASRGSSGSIVSDYELDDRVIQVRSPTGAEDFSLAPESRPARRPTQSPIQWVPGVLSPGVRRGRGVTLPTHPHLVAEVK
jgi:hypothetical protein